MLFILRSLTFEKHGTYYNPDKRSKMLKSDSIIRPRKIATVNYINEYSNSGALPVYRISDTGDGAHRFRPKETISDYKTASRKPKGICKKVLDPLEIYCGNSSLHGLRYVGDTSLSIFERMFWLISFTVAIGFAAYYITNIYQKWNSSPVIISFSPFDAQLKSIPFPSVTICNMNQAKKTEVNKIKADGNLLELKLLDDICNGNEANNSNNNYTTQYDWKNLRNFLIRVGNSCSDMVKSCRWSNENKNCEDLFNNDLTDEGLCCSFNRLPPNRIFRNPNDISLLNQTYPENVYDWNPEVGFSNIGEFYDENMVPKRPLGAGANLGLSILLDAQLDEYYCSSTNSVGFKIIISNPIETPKMADFGTLLSPGVEARISIQPSVREATTNLRSVPVVKRQCYFASERKLIYYRIYSELNCKQECLSTFIYNRCGCSPYFLPRNSSMKYCQQADDSCVEAAKMIIERNIESRRSCNCYTQCNSIEYNWRLSYGNFDDTMDFINIKDIDNPKGLLIIHVFFKENKFDKIIKDRLFSFTELVAYIGGLLGVFLGFSILSMIELIYYVILNVLQPILVYCKKKPVYTQTNCILECQSNYTFQKCSCIPYYLPKNKSIKACGRKDQLCANDAKENMEKVTGNGTSCLCLPSCFGLKFTASESHGKISKVINSSKLVGEWNVSISHLEKNIAVVHFYFTESEFPIMIKSELFGFTEILSNVGGLLGLCMGFSFLSVVEILYFVTLRWVVKRIKDKRKKGKKKHNRNTFLNNEYSKYPFLA